MKNKIIAIAIVVMMLLPSFTSVIAQLGDAPEIQETIELPGPLEVLEDPNQSLQYYKLNGFAFKPLSHNFTYYRSICTRGAVEQRDRAKSFVAPVVIPTGSIIRELEFYYTSGNEKPGLLTLTSNQGNGMQVEIARIETQPGDYRTDRVAVNNYEVDNSLEALCFNFHPGYNGEVASAVCYARVAYTPPLAPSNSDYRFHSGNAFQPKDDPLVLQPGRPGCVWAQNPSDVLFLEMDLPDLVRLNNVTVFYNDDSTNENVEVVLRLYSGFEHGSLLSRFTAFGHGGYGSYTEVIGESTSQAYASYTVVITNTSVFRQICGIRLFYTDLNVNAEESLISVDAGMEEEKNGESQTEHISFHLEDETEALLNNNTINLLQEYVSAGIHFPPTAALTEATLYYSHVGRRNESFAVFRWSRKIGDYGDTDLAEFRDSPSDTGYTSITRQITPPFANDMEQYSYFASSMLPADRGYYLCGLRIGYNHNGLAKNRFIPGIAYMRNSSSAIIENMGRGCVRFGFTITYLPAILKTN